VEPLRRTTLAALAVASMGLLGACTSQPSPKAVAKDVVESLPDLSQTERTCMLGVIDAMTSDELEQLGKNNVGAAITDGDSGDADMQAFIADLSDCRDAG
jgi:hypothetical protein